MSIATYLTALDRDRDALAANLVTKGVQASSSETFTTLVPKVLDIPSGGSSGLTISRVHCFPSLTKLPSNGPRQVFASKTFNGSVPSSNGGIWTDGTNIYHSQGSNQKVFDKTTSTWSAKTWNGLTSFSGQNIRSDGTNIYYSGGSSATQYVLDKSTSTWNTKTWNIDSTQGNITTKFFTYLKAVNIWTDGYSIYFTDWNPSNTMYGSYVLDVNTSTWYNG